MTEKDIEADLKFEAELARRPGGAKQMCKYCWYWDVNSWELEDLEKEIARGAHLSDMNGACRRHAPRAIERLRDQATELLGKIALAAEKLAGIEHEDDPQETIYYTTSIYGNEIHQWPLTNAHDWCGDFQERGP
jgi:hypothetical protein